MRFLTSICCLEDGEYRADDARCFGGYGLLDVEITTRRNAKFAVSVWAITSWKVL